MTAMQITIIHVSHFNALIIIYSHNEIIRRANRVSDLCDFSPVTPVVIYDDMDQYIIVAE